MNEEALIQILCEKLGAPRERRNAPFTSDAEIVSLSGALYALTVDEFSAEDGLSDEDPEALGWSLMIATLSDLLAVGAAPRFFLNALVVGPSADAAWVGAFAAGVREALDAIDAGMLGGDIGTAKSWRFTGFALGDFPAGREPLSRIPAIDEGAILATGTFGDGNLAAVTGATPRFECRAPEAAALAECAAAATDTSDGLANALVNFHRHRPDLRLEIDVGAVPLADGVAEVAAELALPPEAFLLGSAGEYELAALARHDAAPSGATRIGTFSREGDTGIFYRSRDGRAIRQPALPDPREADRYREEIVSIARSMFGSGGRP